MAYTLKDLLDNPDLFKDFFQPKKCSRCGQPAEGEQLLTSDPLPCENCRYQALGEEIENHPIGAAYRCPPNTPTS